MQLSYHTRGNDMPKGKHYIFVHALAEDMPAQEDLVTTLLGLTEGKDYAIWTAEDPAAVFLDFEGDDLASMAVFVPFISQAYLDVCEKSAPVEGDATFVDMLNRRGIAVLPVFPSADVIARFNCAFGDLHGINLALPEATRLLEEQLNAFLPNGDVRERILSEAFSGELFLSYRKKDKDKILQVMKAIHETDAAGAASIWFDEFLVAGQEFNDEIRAHLEASDAMVLVVTPNLLEPGNYVHEVEYPLAHHDLGKQVVPIEAQTTDDRALRAAYEGLGLSTSVTNAAKLERVLRNVGMSAAPRTPFANYLLGMAFLVGFMVERDGERALSLFEEAAQKDCAEALEQLGFMYTAGLVVARDHHKAVAYKTRAFNLLRVRPVIEVDDVLERSCRLLYGTDGLCLMLKSLGRADEARQIDVAFLKVLRLAYKTSLRNRALFESEAYLDLADTHFDERPDNQRLIEAAGYAHKALAALEKAEALQPEAQQPEAVSDAATNDVSDAELTYQKAIAQSVLGAVFEKAGDLDEAILAYEQAKQSLEQLVGEQSDAEYKSKSATVSLNLGMLYRERALAQMVKKPSRSIEFMQPAIDELIAAIEKARTIVEIDPTINNRETLALALLDCGIVTVKKRDAVALLEEAQQIALQLQEETSDGSFDSTVKDITAALNKRRGFFGRLFKR